MDFSTFATAIPLLFVCHERHRVDNDAMGRAPCAVQQLKILWQWVITNHHINAQPMPDKWVCDGVRLVLNERL